MAEKDPVQIPSHLQLFNRLTMRFNEDYQQMLTKYSHAEKIELTEHLMAVVGYISEYAKTKDSNDWKRYADAETELLKKYRNKLKDYTNALLGRYFDFDVVLVEKGILTSEQFNSIPNAKEQSLSDEEIGMFLTHVNKVLSSALYFLYLNDTGETEPVVTLNDTLNVTDEPDKAITKARQLLAIYYFLKAALDIEGRDSNSISGIARFIHLLTGTKFTTVQNSDIYKKYLKMPNYKNDRELITDLNFIRPYFVDLGVKDAVKMIDEEIKIAIKELPLGERKKYENK